MNTLRACAVVGLVVSLGLAPGCGSDSKTGVDGSVRRDTNRDGRFNADAAAGATCVFDGTTYQQGQSFTINCVRYTCQGGGNVTTSGSPCSDASASTADTRTNRDAARTSDTPRPTETGDLVDSNPGRDVSAQAETGVSEAGRRDTSPVVDVGGKDVEGNKDAFVFQDTAPVTPDVAPEEDTAPPEADVAAPTKCSYGGKLYNPGDEFACDCNTCICTSTGAIRSLTSTVCGVDAG